MSNSSAEGQRRPSLNHSRSMSRAFLSGGRPDPCCFQQPLFPHFYPVRWRREQQIRFQFVVIAPGVPGSGVAEEVTELMRSGKCPLRAELPEHGEVYACLAAVVAVQTHDKDDMIVGRPIDIRRTMIFKRSRGKSTSVPTPNGTVTSRIPRPTNSRRWHIAAPRCSSSLPQGWTRQFARTSDWCLGGESPTYLQCLPYCRTWPSPHEKELL